MCTAFREVKCPKTHNLLREGVICAMCNENLKWKCAMWNENVQCAVCVSGRLRKCVFGNLVSQMKSQGFKNTLDFRHAPGIHYKQGFILEQLQLPQRATCQQRGNKCPFFGLLSLFVKIPPPPKKKTFLINSYCSFCTGWCYLGGQRRAAPSSQLLPPAAGLPRLQKHHCKPTPQHQGCLRRCQPQSRRPACWLGNEMKLVQFLSASRQFKFHKT